MRAAKRDEEFAAFVSARQAQLRRIAYAISGDWHTAEDLVQISLSKLYAAWPRIHRKGAEEAYARQIIVRAAIDESRRPWRREVTGADHDEPAAPTRDGVEDRDALVEALQQLPVMQRKVVVLRHWLGLSVEETARELAVTDGTVKSHTARGLARLNALLADQFMETRGRGQR